MKRYLILLIILVNGVYALAQENIVLTENKLTQLVFHTGIKSFKVAIPESLVTQVEDNVLYLQPLSRFQESNMTVITMDNNYYSFTLSYNDSCRVFTHFFSTCNSLYSEQQLPGIPETTQSADTSQILRIILQEKGYIYNYNSVRLKNIYLALKGVYATPHKIYFRIEIGNSSTINYDIDMTTFYIKGRKKVRTSTDEILQKFPINSYPAVNTIESNTIQEIVYEFDKFTISDNKLLYIDVAEVGGDRTLSLPVNNNFIINAKPYGTLR